MSTAPPTYRQAVARCTITLLTAIVSGGLVAAAVLVPAPPALLLVLIPVCVGYPMLAAVWSAESIGVVRNRWARGRVHQRALGELRRDLDLLPETGHPLDR